MSIARRVVGARTSAGGGEILANLLPEDSACRISDGSFRAASANALSTRHGRNKLPWLQTFLDLPNGIPSQDTFRRVFMLIFDREVVAIDGKTVRRSFNHGCEQNPLHLVSAWASEQGLVLGHCCLNIKSNEITAVTLDAMGCDCVA